jgi:signal transduction histidine kinase/CheY-like chemotaxis protein
MPTESLSSPREFQPTRVGLADRWGPSSIRGRLVLLTVALMAPALLVSALFLQESFERERRAVETQLSETTRAMALGVDRQVGQQSALLAGLTSSPLLVLGEYSAFDAQARASAPPGMWIVVRDPTGRHLVNTRFGRGQPLPTTVNRADWAVDDGIVRVSNLFHSDATHRWQLVVQRSLLGRGGVKLEISAVIPPETMNSLLQAQKLPPTWVATLVDARGTVISRTADPHRFVGKSGTPDLVKQLAEADEGVAESTTLDGRKSLMAWSRAPESRWAIVVARPRSELTASAQGALGWAALSGLALLVVGMLVAAWVAEGVVRPIEALAAYAGALGGGQPIARPANRLREADEVGEALARSARSLGEREEELRRLNATLEARIVDRTRELAETTESLIQAQKLEAVGRLTGGIAHDFNNLLTAIQGNLELLGRRVSDPKLSTFIAHARQAAERGAKLTAQLLAFSRRQRLEPEPTDINASVETASHLLTSTLGGTIRVDLVLKRDLWPAMADATQLELVILNLAINARDAMPAGGVLTIETSNVHRTAPADRPESPPPGDYVLISVSDTGTGMTPEIMAKVFEPFFTTKEVGRGSGLGLPQVLGVTKQLGGGVELSSQPGEGSTVAVYLARANSAAVKAGPETEAASHGELNGARVLLVDDDADVRGVTASMLKEYGCVVQDASSGRAALDVLAADESFDLVILDYAMPGLNGGETAAAIRERWPHMPILLMSGYADAQTLTEAWSGPFLHKPFTTAGLSDQVGKLLGRANVVRLRPSAG